MEPPRRNAVGVIVGRIGEGMIAEEDLSLYKLTDDHKEAVNEVLGFYRVYHSMRYVRNRLVFSIKEELHPSLLKEINHAFADIINEGEFTQGGPLKEEKDEPELAEYQRLIFHFNRRSLGRLRQLIDCINRGSVEP